MSLAYSMRSLPLRSTAIAIAIVLGAAAAAPGHACEKNKSANATASNSGCSVSKCAGAMGTSGCAASSACPPSMCSGAKTSSASVEVKKTAAPVRAVTASKRAARKPVKRANGATAAAPTASRTAGLVAIIDPVTGGLAKATPEQLAELSATSKAAGNVSGLAARPSDPEVTRLADGTLTVRLPERLMMNAVAHKDAKGKITIDCDRNDGTASAPAPAPSTWEVK